MIARCVGGLLAIAAALFMMGCSFGRPAGPPPPPPVVTVHEGKVTKVVVNDPHDGGWNSDKSNPRSVVLTVGGKAYDIEGALGGAAQVKPGDRVIINCVRYDGWPTEQCKFGGIVQQLPEQPK